MRSAFSLTLTVMAGTEIREACIQARELAINLNLAYVVFDFNGVSINVQHNTKLFDIQKKWDNVGDSKFIIM